MKLPPVKKLTKRQAIAYHKAIEAAFPLPLEEEAERPKKLTKRERELDAERNSAYSRGRRDAEEDLQREKARLTSEARSRGERLASVRVARDYISVVGQTLDAFAKIVLSEARDL